MYYPKKLKLYNEIYKKKILFYNYSDQNEIK